MRQGQNQAPAGRPQAPNNYQQGRAAAPPPFRPDNRRPAPNSGAPAANTRPRNRAEAPYNAPPSGGRYPTQAAQAPVQQQQRPRSASSARPQQRPNRPPYNPYEGQGRSYRNTLAGDPYDQQQERNPLLQWLPVLISGVVFLACCIIVYILLP